MTPSTSETIVVARIGSNVPMVSRVAAILDRWNRDGFDFDPLVDQWFSCVRRARRGTTGQQQTSQCDEAQGASRPSLASSIHDEIPRRKISVAYSANSVIDCCCFE
jgi:hypothetical protein